MIAAADAFLATHDTLGWEGLADGPAGEVLAWMTTLDNYNNGLVGPEHCDLPREPNEVLRGPAPAGPRLVRRGQADPQVLSAAVENLVAQLTRLPGVGSRTAHRFAFHLLRVPQEEALALAAAIEEVKERVRFCNECGNLTEDEVCAICRDTRRDHTLICVVEHPADLISLERTHEYRGLYHVLGGSLSPIDGVEPGHLRIE